MHSSLYWQYQAQLHILSVAQPPQRDPSWMQYEEGHLHPKSITTFNSSHIATHS